MLVKNYQVLLLDDQVEFHQEMRATFRQHYIFDGARTIPELEKKLVETQYDLLLLDLVLDEDSGERIGLSLIEKAKNLSPGLPVIVVTKDNDAETALEAINLGATNFLYKGKFNYDTWDRKFKKAIEYAPEEAPAPAPKQTDSKAEKEAIPTEAPYTFIGQSAKIMEIKRLLDALSEEPEITVLLTGETGVGKEVAARYLHRQGPRKEKPFQAINLTTVQKTLLESTLFGHVKGSFTGADRDAEGIFAQAQGGILLLDEIGEIDPNIQVKLLRFLEDRIIRPVGSSKDIQLDVQIIAATNRNLKDEVARGNFREDLYHRIAAWTISIPPLRERKDDISLLLEYYAGGALKTIFTPEALEKLMHYNWSGNIRALRNAVKFMATKRRIEGKPLVDVSCLPDDVREYIPSRAHSIEEQQALMLLRHIEEAFGATTRKQTVAERVGLDNIDNLRYRIKTYFQKFPALFEGLPLIRQHYPDILG